MDIEQNFLVITSQDGKYYEKVGLKDAQKGDKYILEVTSKDDKSIALNFVKLGGSN